MNIDWVNTILISISMSVDYMTIGAITFVLSAITTHFGRKIGNYLVKWAGLIAGIVFIAIGLKILPEGTL